MILGNSITSGAVRENPNFTMGSCSSNKEGKNGSVKMSQFCVDHPIDSDKAIKSFKDNIELYLMILNRFRNFQVLPALNSIGQFIEAKSMSKVKL